MKIKVIKTEEEYQEALEHLESLLDAAPGSPEEEALDLISLLIERYEEEYYPIDLPDPIEAIKFRMEQQGLTPKDMGMYLGSQSKVSEVLNNKRPLSLSMIRSLNEGLGIPAEVLLQKPGEEIKDRQYDISDYPFNELVKRDYFPDITGNLQRAKDQFEELLTSLMAVFNNDLPEQVYCHYSDKELNTHALTAWQAKAIQISLTEELPSYSKKVVTKTFLREIVKLSYLSNGPQLAKEYLNKKGIHFITLKHLPKTYLDGACFLTPDGAPLIGMTLRHDRLDNFWYTLMHELAHLFLHINQSNIAFFDDTIPSGDKEDTSYEQEANDLAQEILIPPKEWENIVDELKKAEEKQVIESYSNKLNISPAIIAGRIRWESASFTIHNDKIGSGIVRVLFPEYVSQ